GQPGQLNQNGHNCDWDEHQQQVDHSSRKITTESESQKTRDQNEVLEVGKHSNLGGDPSDHQQFHEQRQNTPEGQAWPGKSSQVLRHKFPPALAFCTTAVWSHQSHEVSVR